MPRVIPKFLTVIGVGFTVICTLLLGACATADRQEQAMDDIDTGAAAACALDRQTMEAAIETFRLLEGSDPTEADLVVEGFLRTESTGWDLAAGAVVVAAPGGVCE